MDFKVAFEIWRRDVKRLARNWVAVVVILGITVLPALYAWFNIGANMDPYANTGNIKVGVVCEDVGATSKQTGDVNLGKRVCDTLSDNDQLGWDFVSNKKAMNGIKSGKYYAVIVIPEDFSEDMISFLSGSIGKPRVEYYVNEKKNAIAPKVTGTGASTLQNQINETFMQTVSETVAGALGDLANKATSELDNASSAAINSLNQTKMLIAGYKNLISSSKSTIAADKKLCASASKSIKDAQASNANMNAVLTQNDRILEDTRAEIDSMTGGAEVPVLNKVYDKVNAANANLKSINAMMGPELVRMNTLTSNMSKALDGFDMTMTSSAKALDLTSSQLENLKQTINIISGSKAVDSLVQITKLDPKDVSDFMKEPISMREEVFYSVRDYGSGMTPFYTMLAIWVGGIVLLAIFRLEVDDEDIEGDITPSSAYLGRWLLFITVGIVQGLVVCLGDILLLRIQCEHPILFTIVGIEASFVFVSLIYALATAFRHIGKAFVIILVIMQIPGSAGTYPIEMTGAFFRAIHPLLPFTYGINAMRETIAGMYKLQYVTNLLVLGLFFLIAMFIGLVLRFSLLNINRMVDVELSKTGLTEIEHIGREYPYDKIKRFAEIIGRDEEVASKIRSRREHFEANYDKYARQGVAALIVVPIVLLFVMFIATYKMIALTLWIVTLVGIAASLLVMEYRHMKYQEIMGGKHDEE